MTSVWVAVWVGIVAPTALYVGKRIVDYLLPPGRHWPLLDPLSQDNDKEHTTDDYS